MSGIGFASQMKFYSRVLLRIWAKIAHSNKYKVDQNFFLTHKFRREIMFFSLTLLATITCQIAILVHFKIVRICNFGQDPK